MHLKEHLFPFLLYQCYLLQSFPIIFIQVMHEKIKEMKINNNTLTYKINYTRLACKVQCEHTEYTTTLIDEKHVKRKNYLSKSLREEEKKKKKKRHHTTSHMLCLQTLRWLKSTKFIALWTLYLPQSNVCEKQLELQQVSLIPFPYLENIIFCKS